MTPGIALFALFALVLLSVGLCLYARGQIRPPKPLAVSIINAPNQGLLPHFDHSLTISAYDDENDNYRSWFTLECEDCDVEVAREEA